MTVKKSILLIHPPVAKPCEPPAGVARLAGALISRNIPCRVYDANMEGISDLLNSPVETRDTWSARAARNIDLNLRSLRSKEVYSNRDRYKRAVMDVNRVLSLAGLKSGAEISLSNYTSPLLSPVRSSDLLAAAERYEENPFYPGFKRRLLEIFSEEEPEIVGFSINFMSQALCAFAMMGFIRREFKKARIVLGGGLVTSWMAIPGFRNPYTGLADDLIRGPGEEALLAMCGGTEAANEAFSGLDYSASLGNGYISPGMILPYSTSMGCYWQRCAFCPEKAEKSGYAPLDMKAVTRDVGRLTREMDPCLVHFLDNALTPGFLRHLSDNPPGAPWYGFVRITSHLADPDFVRGLRDSGCVMLKLGVESGDQAVLDELGKGIDLGVVSRALKTLRQASISTYAYLLFGTPAETPESARKTLDFTLKHADEIGFLNLAVFNLPAYSEEAKGLETVEFYEGDLSLYSEFVHPKGWNRDLVRRFIAKEFRRKAPIRAILGNDPPFFTSNHAPLLAMHGNP